MRALLRLDSERPRGRLLPSLGLLLGAAAAQAGVPALKLDPTGAVNPTVLRGRTPEITRSASKLGVTNCQGHVSGEPVAVVDIPSGSSDIAITVNGLDLLVVMTDDGRSWCANAGTRQPAAVRPGNWPGGMARVFVGPLDQTSKDPKQYDFSLVAENVTQPIGLGWTTPATTALDGKLTEPVSLSVRVDAFRDYGFRLHSCGGSTAAQPAHFLELKRPLAEASLFVATGDPSARAILIGPITDDLRKVGSRCLGRGISKISAADSLKPGRYALLGGQEEGKATTLALVMMDPDSRSDPLSFAGVADGLPVEQRSVTAFMPFWGPEQDGRLPVFAPLVQELFGRAPAQLFVFARYDLDGSMLDLDDAVEGERAYPRKGEPLLLYHYGVPRVLAADGSTYTPKAPDLFAAAPDGPLALPTEARNTSYAFSPKHTQTEGQIMMGAEKPSPRDPSYPPFIAYLKVIETYDACMRRVWKPVEKQVAALRNTRLRTSADELKLAGLETQYRKKEEQTCKPDRLQVARAAYYQSMKAVHRARRDRALQTVNARLRQLFSGSGD